MARNERQKATTHNISLVPSGHIAQFFYTRRAATVGNCAATIPSDARGRKPQHDWASIPVGGFVVARGGSATYWSRKLKRKFVTRGDKVYRVK